MDKMREEFEAWCDRNEYNRAQRMDGTGYNNDATKRAWSAWQAARQSTGQERGEAVAWQYRVGTEGLWATVNTAWLADHARQQGCEIRALYAAPTDTQSRIAELEAQLANWQRAYATETGKCAALAARLTESREREGRMREAFQSIRAIDNGEAYRIASEAIGVVP